MWSIGDVKLKGRTAFKANYWRSVLAALILSLFIGGTTASGSATSGEEGADLSDKIAALSEGDLQSLFVVSAVAIVIVIVVSVLLKIFLFNPLEVGCYSFFKKNISDNSATLGSALKEGFSNYVRVFLTLFLRDLFIALWSILLVIPGIIASYAYSMVPFILTDNPELSATEALKRSKQMMQGNKGRAFLLDLSFIGWYILSAITCGILGVFWTAPYHNSTHAALYAELKNS